MLILQRPWTQQPQTVAAINPALNATAVWSGGTPTRVLLSGEETVLSGATFGASPIGRGLSLSAGTQSLRLAADQNRLFKNKNAVTIAIYRRPRSATDSNTTLFGYIDSIYDRIQCHAPYSGSIYFDFCNSVNGRLSTSYAKTVGPESLVFVGQTSGEIAIWRNGVKIASKTATASEYIGTVVSPFYLGSVAGVGSDAEDIALCVIAGSVWTDRQIRDWANRPFAETFSPWHIMIPTSLDSIVTPTLTAASAENITTTTFRPRVTFTR